MTQVKNKPTGDDVAISPKAENDASARGAPQKCNWEGSNREKKKGGRRKEISTGTPGNPTLLKATSLRECYDGSQPTSGFGQSICGVLSSRDPVHVVRISLLYKLLNAKEVAD